MIDRDAKYRTIPKTCITCGQSFLVTPSDAKRGRGKFCSSACNRPNAIECNEKFFDVTSPEMAWVLGLVFSDGNLSDSQSGRRARLSIKSIDYQLLDTVKHISENGCGIYKDGITSSGNEIYRLEWSHPQIISSIQRWGIVPRKTLNSGFPSALPKGMWSDFIRGLFDGDGCVHLSMDKRRKSSYLRQCCFLGTQDLLRPIPIHFGLDDKIIPYRAIAKLVYYKVSDLRKIFDAMYYSKDVPCLERKRVKFEQAISVGIDTPIVVQAFERNGGNVSGYNRFRAYKD